MFTIFFFFHTDSSKNGISTRIVGHLNVTVDPRDFLIINHPNSEEMSKALDLISRHKLLRSLMIFDNLELFKSLASKHLDNALFYLLTQNYSQWKQVLIFQNPNPKVIINDVNFDENGVAILNENLQKLELVPTTESWEPYVTISDCNSVGRNCSYKGMLVDYMNIWSKHLNFTWDLHKDITGEWGLKPKSGMHNSSLFEIHFKTIHLVG